MIVADVNLIVYLYLPGPFSTAAEAQLLQDGEWAVPRLWRSEFANVLSTYVRQRLLTLEQVIEIHSRAARLLDGNEYEVPMQAVLRLAASSGCSAYDCEYVVLAEHLEVPLVTADAKLAKAFPDRVRLLSASG